MLSYSVPWRANIRLPIREIWFARAGERVPLPWQLLPNGLRLFHIDEQVDGLLGKWTRARTLITELGTIDELEARLHRNTRYEIRRALDRDGVVIADDWTVEQFIDFADRFDASNPNRPAPLRLNALHRLGRLSVRAAILDGQPMCAHAIVDDGDTARGLHSVSARRALDKARNAQVARANRALYFRDLFHMRERGIRRFDWGGFTGIPGNGIDALKLEFKGVPHESWCFDGVLLPGRRYLRLQG